MTQLCILDFDGTLSDTHNAIAWSIESTFDSFGVARPSHDAIADTIHAGLTMPDVMRVLHEEQLSAVEIAAWTARYRTIYDEEAMPHTELFPGVEDALNRAKASGIRLAVVSNKGTVSLRRALAQFDIQHLIDVAVGNEPNVSKKPDPQVFINYVQPHFPHTPPAEIVVAGDTHVDILFARAIGVRSCWAEYGYGDADTCRSLEPDMTIKKFSDFLDAIQ
ncbi:HAD family hydrolase [Burkholderia aenigmatica]|uniref:HAD family hydrolase n=1 Tax=Burkholderia aenigmatica TaxID=2015348 RepID=UPI0015C632C2|nr:HAD family hydrolase [Burkholderia aenigmatica]